MFEAQTMYEYMDNPMGKGSNALSNRNLIKRDLEDRYNKLIEKHKDFKHHIYYDASSYYMHIIIPSESERNNTYDVVIQLTPENDEIKRDTNLKRYVMQVFSNCPSFTYTYANVYDGEGKLITSLKSKYERDVFRLAPLITNPGQIINYEKSVFFACMYITTHNSLMNKFTVATLGTRLNKLHFASSIRNTDQIKVEINRENSRLKKEKDKNKEPVKKLQDMVRDKHLPLSKQAKSGSSKTKVTPKAKIQPRSKKKKI